MLTGDKNLDFVILNKLEDNDLVNLCQTNQHANALCNNQTFWLNRIMIKFPYLGLDLLKHYKGDRDWSQYYIKDLRQITTTNAQEKLNYASMSGRLDHIAIAFNKGADITYENDRPVRWSSENGYLDVVKYLAGLGANIRAANNYSIRRASLKGHLDVVKYLVGLGANTRAWDNQSVRWASKYGHLEVVKFLVENGADVRAKNDESVKFANVNKHYDVVDYLVSQGAPDPR